MPAESPIRRYSDASHLEDIRRRALPLGDEWFLLAELDRRDARIAELTALLERARAERRQAIGGDQ